MIKEGTIKCSFLCYNNRGDENMEFVELTDKEYENFVKGHEQESYMQSLDLKNFKNNNNIKCYIVGVKEKKKVLAFCFPLCYYL